MKTPKEINRLNVLDIKIKAAVFNSANEMCSLLQDDLTMERSSIFKRRMDDILTCCRNMTGNKRQLLNTQHLIHARQGVTNNQRPNRGRTKTTGSLSWTNTTVSDANHLTAENTLGKSPMHKILAQVHMSTLVPSQS